MDKKFDVVLRTGKTIDMLAEIENLQEVFYHDMQASVSSFDTYEEVIEETRNDLLRVKTVLATFEMLGYIDNAECHAMLQAVNEQRKSVLEGLEGKS